MLEWRSKCTQRPENFFDADFIEIFDGMEVGSFLDDCFMALEVLVDFDGGE